MTRKVTSGCHINLDGIVLRADPGENLIDLGASFKVLKQTWQRWQRWQHRYLPSAVHNSKLGALTQVWRGHTKPKISNARPKSVLCTCTRDFWIHVVYLIFFAIVNSWTQAQKLQCMYPFYNIHLAWRVFVIELSPKEVVSLLRFCRKAWFSMKSSKSDSASLWSLTLSKISCPTWIQAHVI